MSRALANIRGLFEPSDPRSEREIDDDLDAEFAFHIEQLEAELIEQGVPPEHSPDLARARFGNQEKLKQRCKAIAMKERIMLQRINTVLMVIVMLAVVGVSIQIFTTQRANSVTLQEITSQIAAIQGDATGVPSLQDAATEPKNPASVLIEGDIKQAGWYPITTSGRATYLHEVVQLAGGVEPNYAVHVRRPGQSPSMRYTGGSLLGDSPQRIVLRPGDEIFVESDPIVARGGGRGGFGGSGQMSDDVRPGIWHQVDREGEPVSDGYTLTVLSSDDVRNLSNFTLGTLILENHEIELTLEFTRTLRYGNSLTITDRDGDRYETGRWQVSDDLLALNITPAVEAITEPLWFRHAGD